MSIWKDTAHQFKHIYVGTKLIKEVWINNKLVWGKPSSVHISTGSFTLYNTQTKSLSASATDHVGGVVYTWYLDGHAVHTGRTYTFPKSSVKTHSLYVRATNGAGYTNSGTIHATVKAAFTTNLSITPNQGRWTRPFDYGTHMPALNIVLSGACSHALTQGKNSIRTFGSMSDSYSGRNIYGLWYNSTSRAFEIYITGSKYSKGFRVYMDSSHYVDFASTGSKATYSGSYGYIVKKSSSTSHTLLYNQLRAHTHRNYKVVGR